RRRMDTIAEVVKILSQGLMPGFLNSDWIKRHVAEGGPGSPPLAGSEIQDSKFKVYRFGVACVAGMPFIGIGNLPSAPFVSAMNAWSSRIDSNTASTRASIISFSRTA